MAVLIRTLRWLLQLKVWRFVGFASALIGLLCFALSSSFNHLFGEWNLLKKFVYSVWSFIICLMILYANKWQGSRSLRFKAHTAFLVLTITSVYSFFFDKVMKGKPDAYSLISCASFAIMSLGLWRQNQCGFEVDLMYFYLGCLIVQLMKIKLPLAILGVGYSYCLVILRSFISEIDAIPESEYLEDQQVVIQVDSRQQIITNSCSTSITQQFLTCIMELQQNNLNLINMFLQRLKDNSELMVTDHNFINDALPPEIINRLHDTAKLMVDAGLEKELSKMFSDSRREWLEELVIKNLLGLAKMGFQDYMIGRWIRASKVALKILFPSERRLQDRIFSGFSSASDLCFLETCRGVTIQLLNFAVSFANGSHSVWRLFKIIDLFKTLRELIPDFQSLFPDSLANEAIKVQDSLGEVGRDIFIEFRNLIFHIPDAELDAWADGGVHPMICEVTGYLVFAFWARQILEHVLQEYPMVADGEKTFSFDAQMERSMEEIERKLEAKSKIYEDPALRYFFMLNNLSQVKHLLGNLGGDRFRKSIELHVELYYRSSWNKLVDILKMDSNETMSMKIDKLSLFNQQFKEICNTQSTWSSFDKKLREQMIISLENMLLPAYGNFVAGFADVLGKHADEQIEYGISDIKDQLSQLFKKEGWQNLGEAFYT